MKLAAKHLVLVVIFLVACRAQTHPDIGREEAITLANRDFARELPQMPIQHLRIETQNLGGKWRVSYVPQPGSTGGPIVLEVNKQTGAVTWISAEQ